MQFDRPLVKLPILFSAEALEAEARALPKSSWIPHPSGFPGNDAVRLVTPDGEATDGLDGQMGPTGDLLACPCFLRIMDELGATWGRSRLMGLAAGAEVPAHIDSHYYWRTHLRIHIPVITNPAVSFTCGGETVNMRAGECWVFDSFQRHEVINRGAEHRIHLVLDTAGGGRLWDLIHSASSESPPEPAFIPPGKGDPAMLKFEKVNSPTVMSPWEMSSHFSFLLGRTPPQELRTAVSERLERLVFEWGGIWACYEASDEGFCHYRKLLVDAARELGSMGAKAVTLDNEIPLYHVLGRMVFSVALASDQSTPEKPASGYVAARRVRS